MEDIFEQNIIKNLKKMYGKKQREQVMRIFFLRAMIYYDSPELTDKQVLDFLIEELHLPRNNLWVMNGVEISKFSYWRPCSLESILGGWKYRYLEMTERDEKGEQVPKKDILIRLFLRWKQTVDGEFKYKRKKTLYYKERYTFRMLEELYREFSFRPLSPERIEGLEYPKDFNWLELTFDERCERYASFYQHHTQKLTEKELEDYLYLHPEVLGLVRIRHRQYKTANGIIDLLGEDKEGNWAVVELKTKRKPKDLLWQLKAYTEDLKRHRPGKIRTIAVTPPLEKSIRSQIDDLDCDLYYYYRRKGQFIIKNRTKQKQRFRFRCFLSLSIKKMPFFVNYLT